MIRHCQAQGYRVCQQAAEREQPSGVPATVRSPMQARVPSDAARKRVPQDLALG